MLTYQEVSVYGTHPDEFTHVGEPTDEIPTFPIRIRQVDTSYFRLSDAAEHIIYFERA